MKKSLKKVAASAAVSCCLLSTAASADGLTTNTNDPGPNAGNGPLAGVFVEPVDCACDGVWSVGDRVVALVNNPENAPSIAAGDLGTVVCGYGQPGLPLLVAWDNWALGHEGNGFCECPGGATAPADSAWWVQCSHVEAYTPPVDCACPNQWVVGDRVRLTIDNPGGGTLMAGATGTVVCGTGVPSETNLLVEWDDWAGGHDGNGFCNCPEGAASLPGTGWYVACEAVEPLPATDPIGCQCDGFFYAGDRVVASVDDPSSASGIPAGTKGTVRCGIAGGLTPVLLIEWDGWSAGHNGLGNCGCPVDVVTSPGSSWFVGCDEVTWQPGCASDFNHDGSTDFNDLLQLLGNWGPCPAPCVEDLDRSGGIGFDDLLSLLGNWGPC